MVPVLPAGHEYSTMDHCKAKRGVAWAKPDSIKIPTKLATTMN
ncbi:MAG: hypothetical protein WC256_03955 [Desulfurivibrionaceae bacterium]